MPEASIHNETELLRRMSDGDERAFEEVFSIYRDKLYHYLLKLTHAPEIAEEIVIDIFLKIWLGRTLLKEVTRLEPFLITVARNKGIDFLRTAARHTRLQAAYQAQFEALADKAADELLIDAELRGVLIKAVNELPPQQQAIYRLRSEQGLSYQEIADVLHLSSHTVRNHLQAASQSLQRYLKKQLPGDTALICFFLLH